MHASFTILSSVPFFILLDECTVTFITFILILGFFACLSIIPYLLFVSMPAAFNMLCSVPFFISLDAWNGTGIIPGLVGCCMITWLPFCLTSYQPSFFIIRRSSLLF